MNTRTLIEPRGRTCDLEWHELGQVVVEDGEGGTVTVEYMDMPARFWRFTITTNHWDSEAGRYDGVDTLVLTTGSGRLGEYLPIAERFASGMLAVA